MQQINYNLLLMNSAVPVSVHSLRSNISTHRDCAFILLKIVYACEYMQPLELGKFQMLLGLARCGCAYSPRWKVDLS